MKKIALLFTTFFIFSLLSYPQKNNLVSNGDFKSLKFWTLNENLRKNGKVTLLPRDSGVMIYNPVIDLDGSLFQKFAASGDEWLTYSAKIRPGKVFSCATVAFVALDKSGNNLATFEPFSDRSRISGTNWKTYSGIIHLPANTSEVRILLTVLDGECSFANITVNKYAGNGQADGPPQVQARTSIITGKGFSVDALAVDRPFWELFSDDIDGDGEPEIIGCDVDGIVTVRSQGYPPFLTYAAGALIYQFEAADLNNDGIKEILLSSVDPKIPVKAIDLSGNVIRTLDQSGGHERLAATDMDGDGKIEIAVSKRNLVQGSGIAGGLVLYNSRGEKIWEKDEIFREFHFADILSDPGIELVVGGPRIEFRIYNREGKALENNILEASTLAHFSVADINTDGIKEIIASIAMAESPGSRLLCITNKKILWDNTVLRQMGNPENNIAVGDFAPDIEGLETITVSPHTVFLYDAKGTIIYQSRDEKGPGVGDSWMPDGINCLDIAFWNEKEPHLYLSSSRFRQPAYYKIDYTYKDELRTYLVPDQEKHLEDLYSTLKQRPVLPAKGKEKVKVILSGPGNATERSLISWKHILDSLGSSNLEFLTMTSPSDLYGHYQGTKLTPDQIVAGAALYEKTGVPFGYNIAHSCRPWISEESIRRSAESAPEMFRFLYIAENLENLYNPLYKDMLKWLDRLLKLCLKYNLKMVMKEKHDDWGLLPADPEIAGILFRPEYKNIIVPLWSTNQPYQPEIELGGMLGLKNEGLCNEFGMSTQYWNWHEWGTYPRGIRDVSPFSVCPSDIILRLELMGIALGGTWIHIEGGQQYLQRGQQQGLMPLAKRHRDLAYELIRKNILTPGVSPVNINKTTVVRSLHPEITNAKKDNKRIVYPYYDRNTDGLRRGFIPAAHIFEPYPTTAFPWLAYSSAWNVCTCFPQTPFGWIPIAPPQVQQSAGRSIINTDGEKIMVDNKPIEADEAMLYIKKVISEGAEDMPLKAPGVCMIIQETDEKSNTYIAVLIDPGYLSPKGVATTIKATKLNITNATDMVSGGSVKFNGNACPVQIQPGAFRIIKFELSE